MHFGAHSKRLKMLIRVEHLKKYNQVSVSKFSGSFGPLLNIMKPPVFHFTHDFLGG